MTNESFSAGEGYTANKSEQNLRALLNKYDYRSNNDVVVTDDTSNIPILMRLYGADTRIPPEISIDNPLEMYEKGSVTLSTWIELFRIYPQNQLARYMSSGFCYETKIIPVGISGYGVVFLLEPGDGYQDYNNPNWVAVEPTYIKFGIQSVDINERAHGLQVSDLGKEVSHTMLLDHTLAFAWGQQPVATYTIDDFLEKSMRVQPEQSDSNDFNPNDEVFYQVLTALNATVSQNGRLGHLVNGPNR